MNEEYSDYLNSEAWKSKRIQRMAISHFRCAACKAKSTEVHHLTYERIFNEDMQDLLPLCRNHHICAEEAKRAGLILTTGHPLHLLAETILVLAQYKQKAKRVKEPTEVFQCETKNKTQRDLLGEHWFTEALKMNRKPFLKLCRKQFNGQSKSRLCANAIALWDKNRRHNGNDAEVPKSARRKTIIIHRPSEENSNFNSQTGRLIYDPK